MLKKNKKKKKKKKRRKKKKKEEERRIRNSKFSSLLFSDSEWGIRILGAFLTIV